MNTCQRRSTLVKCALRLIKRFTYRERLSPLAWAEMYHDVRFWDIRDQFLSPFAVVYYVPSWHWAKCGSSEKGGTRFLLPTCVWHLHLLYTEWKAFYQGSRGTMIIYSSAWVPDLVDASLQSHAFNEWYWAIESPYQYCASEEHPDLSPLLKRVVVLKWLIVTRSLGVEYG